MDRSDLHCKHHIKAGFKTVDQGFFEKSRLEIGSQKKKMRGSKLDL